MRKRDPGFYVVIRPETVVPGLPKEMLDGPWMDAEAARRRADKIVDGHARPGTTYDIVEIADDGITVAPVE